MNIAPIAAPGISFPLQGLWRWFMAIAAHGSATAASKRSFNRKFMGSPVNGNGHHPVERSVSSGLSARRPLRIIHIHEPGQAPAHAGRMVISGRMADVCAELDRLAAREAALH